MNTKKKIKPLAEDKNVRVDISTYLNVKAYCDTNGVKIGWFYDQAAKEKLQQQLKATS